MDKDRANFDKSLLIPLLPGIASLLGICLIIGLGWARGQDSQTNPTQTETPFQYILLATETINPAPASDIAVSQDIVSTPIMFMQPGATLLPIPTEQTPSLTAQSATSIGDVLAPTAAQPSDPIFDTITLMEIGTYDDSDYHIARAGAWIDESNMDSVYQGTLLISENVGNYIAFHFVGTLMALGYQSNLDAGEININIDGQEYIYAQDEGFEWISPELLPGSHYVILTHESGTSVNLDYIDIPN